MTAAGPRRGAGLLLATLALAVSAGAAHAQGADAPAGPRHFVNAFCLPLAGGYVPEEDTGKFLKEWAARPGASSAAAEARPTDAEAPGQIVRFDDPTAPTAFMDRRRDACSLIWKGPAPPAFALDEIASEKLPVGQGGAMITWAKVSPAYGGPPPPPKFILRIGGSPDRGVCAGRRDDLRLRDGSTVSMIQLAPCRLGPGEKVEDGRSGAPGG